MSNVHAACETTDNTRLGCHEVDNGEVSQLRGVWRSLAASSGQLPQLVLLAAAVLGLLVLVTLRRCCRRRARRAPGGAAASKRAVLTPVETDVVDLEGLVQKNKSLSVEELGADARETSSTADGSGADTLEARAPESSPSEPENHHALPPYFFFGSGESELVVALRQRLQRDGSADSVLTAFPGSDRWFEDLELLRYVRARKTLDESELLFRQGLRYRIELAKAWGVDTSATGSFGHEHANCLANVATAPPWWTYLQENLPILLYGSDSFGLPISYSGFGPADLQGCAREVGLEAVQRYGAYQNDYFFDRAREATQSRRDGAMPLSGVIIVDMFGLGWRHFGDVRVFNSVGEVAKLLHPERQRRLFVVRAPRTFSVIWRLVAPAMDRRTVDKITILNVRDSLQPLFDEIGKENVPDFLGGDYDGLPFLLTKPLIVAKGSYAQHQARCEPQKVL